MIQRTTSLLKIAELKKRIRVIRGGQGAGKTISILILLINHASSQSNKEILILSAELTKMRLTVIKDFVKLMRLIGIYDENRFLAGTLYRFPNGSFIKFIGLDKSDVGKGLRSDVAYFNEVNKIDFESYRQVASRAGQVYADYNPDSEFYIDTDVIKRDDCDFLQLTFKDNELLSENERNEILMYQTNGYNENGTIKNEYWANLWNVYGLGNIGNLQGVVFNNWAKCDEIPKDAEFIAYGIDWGFTSDPTTLTAVYRYDSNLYLDELIYETGLTNSDIIKKLTELGVQRNQMIVADSAEPKSIEDLRRAGFRIEGAKKGPDSIRNSIDTLQQQKIFITAKSTNFIKEAYNYRWATDSTGKNINVPEDKNNHCFIGETLITTINGLIRIDNIKVGDLVLTSNGYKKVLKTFNNGVQQVNKYTMQLDTNLVYLCSTKEHKIKTTKGWKQISKLKSGQMVYQCKDLTEKNITYTQKKNISLKVAIDFIKLFMNQLMVKFLKVIKFITKTITLGIIILITWNVLKSINIYQCILKIVSKIILNGLNLFTKGVLNPLKNGINQMTVLNGILNMVKKVGLIENIKYLFARFVKKNIKQDIREFQNTAIITAKLKHLEIGESYLSNVYDFEVEDEHEYFANGILVHNCWDSVRYVALNRLKKSTFFIQ